ncbi:DUF2922 family protein [Pseudoramibacter sp.]|jgi:hypothetical protein|uniref:DUF2922 family protein n=1 Tax=Pseudoramibacter sp. TaxID=2034862 RepID=UPI0025F1A002|nr:DUF2922 family protein [Pseudoramibacter sp.]MCH4071663.1 DUF2922 domain-containing protein [Pseudoramibacter sp.]MCH4105431.1 DUF2922 domain-containing protein [Pseudoramibacter sp.]
MAKTQELSVKFNLASGDVMTLTIGDFKNALLDSDIKTSLDAMVKAGALGIGADAVTGVASAQRVTTEKTDVNLA